MKKQLLLLAGLSSVALFAEAGQVLTINEGARFSPVEWYVASGDEKSSVSIVNQTSRMQYVQVSIKAGLVDVSVDNENCHATLDVNRQQATICEIGSHEAVVIRLIEKDKDYAYGNYEVEEGR